MIFVVYLKFENPKKLQNKYQNTSTIKIALQIRIKTLGHHMKKTKKNKKALPQNCVDIQKSQ